MNWELTFQISTIVVVYVGGLLGVGHFITNTLGKRIDEVGKRIDDLRDQMRTDHAHLANHLTRVENKLDSHISNYSIHNKEE